MTVMIDIDGVKVEPYSLNFLEENKVYPVICIEDMWFRILDETNEPALFDSQYFKTIDDTIDQDWILQTEIDEDDNRNYCSYLGPREFSGQYFFEELFDRKENASIVFIEYMKKKYNKEDFEFLSGFTRP